MSAHTPTTATVRMPDGSDLSINGQAIATLKAERDELLALVRELVENDYLPIDGGECDSCGRSNDENEDDLGYGRCTSDDCPGVQARALLARIDAGGAK